VLLREVREEFRVAHGGRFHEAAGIEFNRFPPR
jgi:hypothetical protein